MTAQTPAMSLLNAFRLTAFVEGLSYLLLLLVAMPLKYAAGMPAAVTVVGTAHGALFVAYVILGLWAGWHYRWSVGFILWVMIASLIPGATFYLEWQLRPRPAQTGTAAR